MDTGRTQPSLARIVRRSASSTPNLLALGASFAGAWLLGHVWLLIAGAWLYLLLVARSATSARFRRRLAESDANARRQLPAASSVTDPALHHVVAGLQKGYDEVARVMSETPESARRHLTAALGSLEELRGEAAELIRDANRLGEYLRGARGDAPQAAVQKLEQEVARSSDARATSGYQAALAIRQEQLSSLQWLAREHERTMAALQYLLGFVEAFPAWVHRVRVLDARARVDRVAELCDDLARMKRDVGGSLQLLDGLAGPSEPELGRPLELAALDEAR